METREGRNQDIYTSITYLGLYPTIEQQIQIDAMLSREFHEEKEAHFGERISQLINQKIIGAF